MELSFLDVQHIRMKKIGAYSLLYRNSIAKGTWKKYGFEDGFEQDNLIFAVLIYIMEQSLKEELCTLDHVGVFIDEVNNLHFKKAISYDQCKELGEFIINTILCDEGKAMYFKAYNFKEAHYEELNISFIKNRMEYVDGVRRVVYSLTDDGYSLLLSTLEIEENLKLTIHEMIFKLHLEKADYDKAVDDIKNIFNSMRRRVQSMEEAMRKIRENPLSYTIEEYRAMTEGNLELLDSTKERFYLHRENINVKIQEFLNHDINVKELSSEEKENLNNLRIIEGYLSRTIDEDQRVLNKHFDLKEIFSKELENISRMSLIERFNFKNLVYDKILEDSSNIEHIDIFLRPLFRMEPVKRYNINKALEYQKNISKNNVEEDEELSFDEFDYLEEERQKQLRRLEKYKKVIEIILNLCVDSGSISLGVINDRLKSSEILMEDLIPTVEIFREVIIELLKNHIIEIDEIREERKNAIETEEIEFQLNKSILEVIDRDEVLKSISRIKTEKLIYKDDIKLQGVTDEQGNRRSFICSDISFEIILKRGRA